MTRPPINLNGIDDFRAILQRNLKFSEDFIRVAKGKVVASFTVDTAGRVINYRIKEGINNKVDAEVLRVVKLFDTEWLPAIDKNQPVAVEYDYPVSFSGQTE